MKTLSVIIPTYNEEAYIERALMSVQFADEIIVVDSFSQLLLLIHMIAKLYNGNLIIFPTKKIMHCNLLLVIGFCLLMLMNVFHTNYKIKF